MCNAENLVFCAKCKILMHNTFSVQGLCTLCVSAVADETSASLFTLIEEWKVSQQILIFRQNILMCKTLCSAQDQKICEDPLHPYSMHAWLNK